MTNATAAIIATSGKIVAIVHNAEGIPSGTVEYAYNSTTDLSGESVLVNPMFGKLSRAQKYIESHAARECLASARCISTGNCYPRFIVSE